MSCFLLPGRCASSIIAVEGLNKHWWTGVGAGGKKGIFPAHFVKALARGEEPVHKKIGLEGPGEMTLVLREVIDEIEEIYSGHSLWIGVGAGGAKRGAFSWRCVKVVEDDGWASAAPRCVHNSPIPAINMEYASASPDRGQYICAVALRNFHSTEKGVLNLAAGEYIEQLYQINQNCSAFAERRNRSSCYRIATFVEAAVPDVLKGAWLSWSAASQLCSTAKCRRTELEVLLDRCRDAIQQAAEFPRHEVQGGARVGIMAVVKHVEDAVNTMKNLVSIVRDRGFLWCVMNAEKLDGEVKQCEWRIEKVFSWVFQALQEHRRREVAKAHEADQENFTSILTASRDGDQLLRAIQDNESMHRTGEEIVVALRKHIQGHPVKDGARPEDVFIQKASAILSQLYGVGSNVSFRSFVISSVEVEFDVNQPIGQGASGKVYRGAWNDAMVAIKRMHADDGRMLSWEQRQAFHHELKTWSDLRHPNVLPFYGACLEAEIVGMLFAHGTREADFGILLPVQPFLVMKFCAFGTVDRYLEQYPDVDRMKLHRSLMALPRASHTCTGKGSSTPM
ncbi:hypothetical protein NM688_g8711 [Phlebia brevispora]|uniref:Uncharacterized protein n=1 Tax=Phlebia brevispora TaxID=194682 RepID=A0ACC1RNQ2_9APHY|nr:hypothetical protein NM688_g8711 [Phlebia brevispora]